MKLSENFHLDEFLRSDTAARQDYTEQYEPSEEVLDNLKFLAQELENVRHLLGHPILISSGYRCLRLNRHLGSRDTSKHVLGLAVDFTSKAGTPEEIVRQIVDSDIEYDQIILEYDRWVHLAFTQDNPRKESLIIDKKGVRPFENTTT
jgi:zinc D-Ala-D-Ala carboxypeptidase